MPVSSRSSEERLALRHHGLRAVAEGMIYLQQQGFTTSEGTLFSMTDGTYAMPDSKPYCFYHSQDRDGALSEGRLYLSFGPVFDRYEDEEGAKQSRIRAAILVAGAMRAQGLTVIWDGEPNVRILVLLDEELGAKEVA